MAQDDMDTDALLRDLEQRASKGSKGESASKKDAGGDEDIEAFLRDLEGGDYQPPPPEPAASKPGTKTKTKQADPLADKFTGLEEAPDAPMAKTPDKKAVAADKKAAAAQEKKEAKEAKKEKTDVKVVERGESSGLKNFVRVAKWGAVLLPTVLAIWLLGAYLSAWVSASWLIAIIATSLVLVLPLAAVLLSKRGRYAWWTAGLSVLLIAALVAPMTASAGRVLERYGHWPATFVGDTAGWSSDHALVKVAAAIGSFAGQLIQPTPQKEVPRKLGGELPLDAVQPAPAQPVPVEPAPAQPAPAQPAPVQPAPAQPAPAQPAPAQPAPAQPAPAQPAPVQPAPAPAPAQPLPTPP